MLSDTNRVGQKRKQHVEPETTSRAGCNKSLLVVFVSSTGKDFSDTTGPKLPDTLLFKKEACLNVEYLTTDHEPM